MSIREAPILVVAGWLARHVLGFCALVLLFSGFARPAWAQSSPYPFGEFPNNIVVNHQEIGITVESSGISLGYNNVWGNQLDYQGVDDPGPGELRGDPLFVNPAHGDYRLSADSPCIDAGDPAVAYLDLDGSPNDLGAWGGPRQFDLEWSVHDSTVLIQLSTEINKQPDGSNQITYHATLTGRGAPVTNLSKVSCELEPI